MIVMRPAIKYRSQWWTEDRITKQSMSIAKKIILKWMNAKTKEDKIRN